jgi:hypothetical protein
MREHCCAAVGQHGGHLTAVRSQPRAADGVDAAVDAMQPPDGCPLGYRRTPEAADRLQLANGDHPVLALRQGHDGSLERELMKFVNQELTFFMSLAGGRLRAPLHCPGTGPESVKQTVRRLHDAFGGLRFEVGKSG